MGFAEFIALAGQHGLWNAVAAVCIVIATMTFYAWSKTRNDVTKSEANNTTVILGALVKLVDKLGTMDDQSRLERTQMIGRMEGMTTAILQVDRRGEGVTKSLDGMVTTLDEFGMRIQNIPRIDSNVTEIKSVTAAIETNLGETINEQIGPVVAVLTSIDTGLKSLVKDSQEREKDSQERDSRIHATLIELTALFQEAKAQFMKLLEPIVIKHMAELLPADKPIVNGIEKGVTSEEPETPKP
jgi:hypothetical protein